MARYEMTPFPVTFILALILSFTLVSTLSDKQRQKLDEIEALLRRLQNEINHMRGSDNSRHTTQRPSIRNSTDGDVTIVNNNNDNTTETIFKTSDKRTSDYSDDLTTQFENLTTEHRTTKTDSDTTIFDSMTKVFDSTKVRSDPSSNSDRLDLTTGPNPTTHQGSFHTTVPSQPAEVTEGKPQTTTEEKKDKDNDIREREYHEDKDTAENELREVENVRRLIDEGEDLERQLKGVFSQLRSLSQCTRLGEKCGVSAMAKCCKGLQCNATWSGNCHLDCIPYGKDCSNNFFCCSGYRCRQFFDPNEKNTYVCQ